MTANVDGMIRAGVEAFRKGNKAEARTLLERAIELDDHNEMAWLWLSAVVSNQDEQRTCLENVLVINPRNERARQGLISLGVDPDMVAPPPEAPPSAPAFVDDYQVPSSSASTDYGRDQPSEEDYDSWVDNLGIGSSAGAMPAQQSASPFTETDFSLDEGFDFDDSFLDESAPGSGSDFSFGDVNSEEFVAMRQPAPSSPPTAPAPQKDDFLDVDALFEEDDAAAVVGNRIDADLARHVDDELLSPVPDRRTAPAPMPEDDVDIVDLFARIPAEIEATRLPGTRTGATPLSYVGLVVLILLNVGAIALLVLQVTG